MTIVESVEINASADVVFDAYVNHIDRWWVRRGTYRYSFAPDGTEPRHIRFVPEPGGRFYEEFSDGSEYTIGHIVGWDPPALLKYTWRAPQWPVETTITVRFSEHEGRTTVEVTHEGFGVDGVPDLGDGYAVGLREILGGLKAWVQDRAA
ncbi:MAG: SRPBCC domain-containing protein [Acidimicrobiia bacterium]|nr:SRPBCC domain-containing protein [Acidimicrobiia bacterium]